jgi:hypothetical protein
MPYLSSMGLSSLSDRTWAARGGRGSLLLRIPLMLLPLNSFLKVWTGEVRVDTLFCCEADASVSYNNNNNKAFNPK